MISFKCLQTAAALSLLSHTAIMAQPTDSIAGERVLGDVVVTGAAHPSHLSASIPQHVLDSKAMLRLGVTDFADALHRLPGVTLRDYGGAGGMKTVSVRGFGAQHTGVSYDGVALSECQTGQIDVSRYSLADAADISLTVGDGDDIFVPARQAAHAAMLSINTMRPPTADLRPHLAARLTLGSFGYVSPFLHYGHNLNERFALAVTGEYVYAENDYPFTLRNVSLVTRERRTNSMMNSGRGEAAFVWNAGRSSRLEGKIYYYDNDRELPGQVRYYTNLSDEHLRDRNFFVQTRYSAWTAGGLAVKLTGKFNWSSSEYTNGLYQGGINDASYWQREAYASACVFYAPGGAWSAAYSADYIFNNLNSSLSTDTRPLRHTVLQTAAVRYKGLRLTAIARLLGSLYFNSSKLGPSARDMRRLSPSVSLSYRLHGTGGRGTADDGLYVRLSYKNIFRAPTFNESYYFHYGSTNLLPESTDQLNLGLSWSHAYGLSSTLRLSADAYINKVKDKIVAVPFNMFVWRTVNVGRVEGRGVEVEAEWNCRLAPRYTLVATANYTLQRSENRTNEASPHYGKQIAYIPEHQASAAVSLENPLVNIAIHGYGISKRYANNEHYEDSEIAGYAELGLTMYRNWRIGNGKLETRLDVKNLLDKQYEIVKRYPMPGRSWQVALEYEF